MITNEGNGYSTETGIFTCPKEGFYFLFFTAKQSGWYAMYHDMGLILKTNGGDIIRAGVTSTQGDQNLQAFKGVVTHLKAGDEVWVSPQGLVESDIPLTSFTGILLN